MIIGHKKSIALLDKAIKRSKLAHSYIFSGPESVGKLTIAKKFAESIILGKNLELSSKDSKNVPLDLVVLGPEVEEKRGVTKEKDIPIGKIREIQKDLALFPYEGKYRVLIVDNAHKMTKSSQNAMLKTLEEPNQTSIIILVTHEEGRILPTIKSRCQRIIFNLVSPDEIKKGLGVSDEIVNFSLSRPGIALEISKSKKSLDAKISAVDKLRSLPKAGINERMKIAEELSKNATEAVKTLELWIWTLHSPALKDIKFFKIIRKIESSMGDIKNTNANTRLVLESLLLNL